MSETPSSVAARHEILVGLHVSDEPRYAEYRAAMKPILHSMGGAFRRDFRVSEVLLGGDPDVNRVFILSFPSEEVMDRFFDDPDYKRARAEFFDTSVAHSDIIASFGQGS